MFWKHPITKKNRFLSVVHATNGIPSYFDHVLTKTSTTASVFSVNACTQSLDAAHWSVSRTGKSAVRVHKSTDR